MELTTEQETDVQKIMAETVCERSFRCYKSEFENLTPVKVISDNAVECLNAKDSFCPMSYRFGFNTMLCECPLRRYLALELGK